MKAGDKQRTQALRLFTAALKKERIDAGATPDEAGEIVVLKRERKRRLEAAELYDKAGRDDLAAKERYEEQIVAGCLRSSPTTRWRRSSTRRSPKRAPPPPKTWAR